MNFLRKLGLFDRRKSKHYELKSSIKCLCAYQSDSGEQNEYSGLITHLSEDGVFLAVRTINRGKVPVRTQLEISFQLPQHPEGIVIHTIVVRSYPDIPQTFSYAAVKFKTQNEEGVKILRQYIPKKM